jgi:hypothetical protein
MNSEELPQFVFEFMNEFFLQEAEGTLLQTTTSCQKERLSKCYECKEYDEENDQCKSCGCFLPVKVKDPFANCPKKEWFANDERWRSFDYNELLNALIDRNPKWKKLLN